MNAAVIATACIWVAFFATMSRDKSTDYGINVVPIFQALVAIIATLVVWVVYFALT